jgi:hypothetical protein
MKTVLAALIYSLLCTPVAQALTVCPMTCAPSVLYCGQFFQQCSEITVTAAEELACMRNYVAADPPPPIAAPQVRAFFKRGWSIIAAMRHGLISNADAWTALTRNMVALQSRLLAESQLLLYPCPAAWCDCFGHEPFCNGY